MIHDNLKEKFKELNSQMSDYNKRRMSPNEVRTQLSRHGDFKKVNKMSPQEIGSMVQGKGVVGVDGSYTTYGNTFPHIIFLAQALAKSTTAGSTEGMKETDVETGLTAMTDDESITSDTFIQTMRQRVTGMEVTAATKALIEYEPFITMFDGGFWRLHKEAPEQWDVFKRLTLQKKSLAVGVIEDVGSFDLHLLLDNKDFYPDSDILFGVLEEGEVYIPHAPYREKFKRAFARFSADPLPIACDFLPEQSESSENMLRLVYSLTPEQGRGIPIWIDIVDKEVKLTREATDMLVEAYVDPVFKERFYTGKRNRR